METKSFRKKYLTNPSFQFSFIGIIVGFSGINLLVVYLAQYYFFLHYIRSARKTGLPLNHIFFQLLQNQHHFMNQIFLAVSICILIFGFIFGLVYSHRITGPLSRIKDCLDDQSLEARTETALENGDLEIRKSDYFKEIILSLNEFINRKRKK